MTDILIGPVDAINSLTVSESHIAGLSATQAIVVYKESAASATFARILDVSSSNVITHTGAAQALLASAAYVQHVCAMTATRGLLVYCDSSDFDLKARVLDVAGSEVTVQSPATLIASTIYATRVARIDDTHALALVRT